LSRSRSRERAWRLGGDPGSPKIKTICGEGGLPSPACLACPGPSATPAPQSRRSDRDGVRSLVATHLERTREARNFVLRRLAVLARLLFVDANVAQLAVLVRFMHGPMRAALKPRDRALGPRRSRRRAPEAPRRGAVGRPRMPIEHASAGKLNDLGSWLCPQSAS
jgi:hypothetical protein